jgi:hypothetical protein
MDSKKRQRILPRTVAENILAAGAGSAVGYAAGAGGTHLLLKKGPYARRLKKLDRARRLKELRLMRGVMGAGATAVGGLAGLAAKQRLRKAREQDQLTRKLAELR